MSTAPPAKKRHRIRFDAEPGFEAKVRILAAKWGVKTNVAIQRAVDLATARKWSDEDRMHLKDISADIREILQLVRPA